MLAKLLSMILTTVLFGLVYGYIFFTFLIEYSSAPASTLFVKCLQVLQ